ncbi:MAG: hypothetical protein LC789_02145 [Actinobacteria bacterium]|nr:hypothetical protein [Actinomycetota bacterium]MCA1721352.1 hypothetical protein [Actinomycetota bacterium]
MRRLLATVVAGMALAIPAAPSRAAAPACDGVTVVVDFNSLGGGEQTGCAAGDPSSGLTALRSAGFTPTRAAQEAGYFVCRINGKPANDPCQKASPANAYWSYWHAQPGGTWTYSNSGAANYDPAPGTAEGWAFGDGKPPSGRPPAKAAPSPSPSPSPLIVLPTAAPTRSAARPAPSPSASASASPARSASPRPSPTLASPATSASPVEAPSPPASAVAVDPVVPPQQDDGGSSGLGFLVAAAVVAALGAAGVWQARRRS